VALNITPIVTHIAPARQHIQITCTGGNASIVSYPPADATHYPELTKTQTTDTRHIHSHRCYKMKCPDCNKAYVGQTGISFQIRFNEHKIAFKTTSHTSNYAKHHNEPIHPFETIQNTIHVLQPHYKGPHHNTLERFHIYAEYHNNNHLNDEHSIFPNIIFDNLLKTTPAINTPLLPTPQCFHTKYTTQDESQDK